MRRFKLAIPVIAFVFSILFGCGTPVPPPQMPETAFIPVIDSLHGIEVIDNYRWLENGEDSSVQEWADAQDQYCRYFLNKFEKRDYLEERINELMKIGMVGKPILKNGRYFYNRRDAGQDHAVYYYKDGLDGPQNMLLDPNSFSEDGTAALDYLNFSPDGKLVAYGKSSSGTENSTLFIYDIDNRIHLPDTIPYARGANVAWLDDNSGFYYSRYPTPGTVPEGDEVYYRKVYYHKVGDSYETDLLIFGEGRDKTEWNGSSLSTDNKYLFVTTWKGWSQSEIFVKYHAKGKFTRITDGSEAIFLLYPAARGFFVLTNYQAPRYKVMYADYNKPKMSDWIEVVPETESILTGLGVTKDFLVVDKLEKAYSKLSVYDYQGQLVRDIALPDIGSVYTHEEYELSSEVSSNEIMFGFNSFFIPPRLYHYEIESGQLTLFDEIKTEINLDNFEAKQVWYQSKDGTEISMFVIHRKDIVMDGSNPTIVYGYGGFNTNEVPYFSRTRTMFLNDGGVVALTNLRGGGEYGEEWHRAGMLESKQNTYDDFIAACEYLINKKYTRSEKLMIEGGSNGGLLVGAVMVQRPGLMKAVICSRPLLDMLRYHKFLIGSLWIPEYGDPDNPDHFGFLHEYSPYHNVQMGTTYPSVLFASADHDTRVDPNHVRKMTAALQAANIADSQILMRLQRQTGHGQGTPVSMVIEELVDEYCFIYWQLGM